MSTVDHRGSSDIRHCCPTFGILKAICESLLQGKYNEAQPFFERSLTIKEAALGVNHPSTIAARGSVADLWEKRGFFDKAFPLMEEVVSALERVRGQGHPDVGTALNNLAGNLVEQVFEIWVL